MNVSITGIAIGALLVSFVAMCTLSDEATAGPLVEAMNKPATDRTNDFYASSRQPLQPVPFIKLPITCIKPGGWLRKSLELQRDGLTGNLGEISVWLTKKDNAWLTREGKGKYGWEEVPYWLRGYARIGYMLNEANMIAEAKIWIEGTLSSQRDNGDFGPIHNHGRGFRDLWAQMLMIQILQSYYDYSHDQRVIPFLTRYFRWQMTIPDNQFLKDYWENSRGGDNLASVYWLYNISGDLLLLDLATKIDRNTANWRQEKSLPNWHNVNIAECFREPATYYLQSGKQSDLEATYRNFKLIREMYGQVPGGMFGSDENARPGHTDPHQATETCGFVEQIASDGVLLGITGDTMWADNAEDVAFNSMPAAFMPDYRALRYLTAPNVVVSDSKNHAPGVANEGPFLLMNPFSSRCCQHNHSSAWVNYAEHSWMATPDNGLAAQFYSEGEVTAKVGEGNPVTLITSTRYPFDENVTLTVKTLKDVTFPIYLRIPSWAKGATLKINGRSEGVGIRPGCYLKVTGIWKNGDKLVLTLPMTIRVRIWEKNKNSMSVDCGALTFSLKISERYVKIDSTRSAIGDSGWQPGVDSQKWPSFEIQPESDWNYGLSMESENPAKAFEIVRKEWPSDDFPFTLAATPIELKARGRKIPSWTMDKDGLCGVLPQSPVQSDEETVSLTLIPMGCARLRISAFPVVK